MKAVDMLLDKFKNLTEGHEVVHFTSPSIKKATIVYKDGGPSFKNFDRAFASLNTVMLRGTNEHGQEWALFIYSNKTLDSGDLNEESWLGCSVARPDKDKLETHWHGYLKYKRQADRIITFNVEGKTPDQRSIFTADVEIDRYPEKTK